MDLDVAAADRGDGLAEIDLHDAGVPVEFEVPVVVRTMLLAPLLHVALHGRRALSPLSSTSLSYTRLAGVTLLARPEPVRGQPRVDRVRMHVDQGTSPHPLTTGLGERSSMVAYFLTVSSIRQAAWRFRAMTRPRRRES